MLEKKLDKLLRRNKWKLPTKGKLHKFIGALQKSKGELKCMKEMYINKLTWDEMQERVPRTSLEWAQPKESRGTLPESLYLKLEQN